MDKASRISFEYLNFRMHISTYALNYEHACSGGLETH